LTRTEFQARLQSCDEDLLKLVRLLFDAVKAGAAFPGSGTTASYDDEARAAAGTRFLDKVTRLLRGNSPPHMPGAATLSSAQWNDLRQLTLEAVQQQGRMDIVARELLLAVDGTIRDNLWKLFEACEARVAMRPGDVFPIAAHNLKDLFRPEKVSITPRPSSKNLGLGRLSYLGVMPEQLQPYEVEYNFAAGPALAGFLGDPVVGVLLPNLDLEQEFTLERRPPNRFFNVTPDASQRERILTLLDEAERQGATLVLQPELSVTRDLVEALGSWYTAPQRRPATYIAGSFHGTDGTRNVNRAPLFTVVQSQPWFHDKFNPYELKKLKGEQLTPPLREDIPEGPLRLTVHWSRGWSFTTLICKDILDDQAQALLSALRLNFVFLVSMSAETESFRRAAETLLNTGQTMTFMANFAGTPRQAAAAALAVTAVEGERPQEYSAQQVQRPSLLLFRLRQRRPGWQPS
jgi:hypothetical protein